MANPPRRADEVNPVNNHPEPSSSTDQVNGSPIAPPNTLNPVSRNDDDSDPSSTSGILNIQAVIERLNSVNAESRDSPDSNSPPDLSGPVRPVNSTLFARPSNNNTVPSSTSPTPLNTRENNRPLVNGDFIHPPLHPSSPTATAGTTGIPEGVYINGLGPAIHPTGTNGITNGPCSLTSESSPPSTVSSTDSPPRVSTNVVDPSNPPNNTNGSDTTDRFYNNVDGASSPRDQAATNSTEALRPSDSIVTDNPQPSSSSDIVTTENPETSTSSNIVNTDHSENLLPSTSSDIINTENPEPSTDSNIFSTDHSESPQPSTSSNIVNTGHSENLLSNRTITEQDTETADNSRLEEAKNVTTTTINTEAIDASSTGNQDSESSSSATHTAQVLDTVISGSGTPVNPTHTAPALGAGNSESNNSSNSNQTTQALDTGNSESDNSSNTNHIAESTEIESTLNPLSDTSTLITNNPQVIDGLNSENPESSNSAKPNTNNTESSFDPASVLPERSTSLGTVNTADTRFANANGLRLRPSTPPQFTSQTPRYSVRALSGDSRLESPSTNIRPRDASAPITATRQRRTMTTEDGSPIRAGGSGQNNGTAPGAPQSPRWHFNLLLRHASGSDSDIDGEPSTPTRPGPSRFVAGSRRNSPVRHNSPALRRVHGSESLRNLSTEHEQNPPMVNAADEPEVNGLNDIQEEEAAAAEIEQDGLINPAPAAVVLEEAEEDAPPVEGDLPVYNPADDDFIEEDAEEEDDDDANMQVGEDAPEGVLLAGARRYLRQVGAEVDILDEIEAAALVRGSGAAVRARMALVFAEEGVVGALRAAVRAVEMHREEAQRLADVARALRAEALVAEDRAISNAVALEAARRELVALQHQVQRNECNGF